jgi:hypothetical protein
VRTFVVAAGLWLSLASAAHATPARLLYASDWNGPTQIFAADPSSGRTVGQVTFGGVPPCRTAPIACGFTDPMPSPDGTKIAFLQVRDPLSGSALWIADADGRNARRIGETGNPLSSDSEHGFRYALWSPDSKELVYRNATGGEAFVRANGQPLSTRRWFHGWPAYDAVVSPDRRWTASVEDRQIVVTNRRTGRVRVLLAKQVFSLAWSPDSRALAYVAGRFSFDTASTGDIGVVTLDGRDRTVVHRRGQISAVAWTKPRRRVAYRAPEAVNGVFAGGPIARLAADGARVAFAACLDVFSWTPAMSELTEIGSEHIGSPGTPNRWACLAPNQRDEIYDLAVAGDRVAWGEKTSGLSFRWWLFQARLVPVLQRYELATGSGGVGSNWYGGGGLAGAAGALAYSVWETNRDPTSEVPITSMTLFRATETGCPCPAIVYGAAPEEFTRGAGLTPIVALDTDGARLATLRYDRLVVYDKVGNQLSEIDVRPAAAQFAGDDVVVLVPNELRIYTASGTLRRSWPVQSASVGRDCRYYSEPQCNAPVELTLEDAARGLATYVVRGEVHVLRLDDGRDTVVGYGSEARFMDNGLVYADGARVRMAPWGSLR